MGVFKKSLDYLTGHRTHIMMSLFLTAILVRSLMLSDELFAESIYDLLWGILFYGIGAGASKTGTGAKEAFNALNRNNNNRGDNYEYGYPYSNTYGGSRFDSFQAPEAQSQEE